ncbi:membrane protein, partial [Mycobacterium rhizamassiliense]
VFTRIRLIGAVAALITAVVVGWHSAPPAPNPARSVDLRSTAAPMETTMKSPIVATTDPSPFDPCKDMPLGALQGLGLAFTPPEYEDGLRCHLDAGNYQMAVEPIIWRTYEKSLPPDALETTIGGHRAATYWVVKPTYHNSYWFFSCMVAFKTSYGVLQQALYYSAVYSNPEVDCPSTNLQRANDLIPYYKF